VFDPGNGEIASSARAEHPCRAPLFRLRLLTYRSLR
jgi:hypothetical protein